MAEQLSFMAVHAHPDDEVFSTGGVFAQYAQEGIHSVLVTCTGGEEGEIVDPDMNVEEIKPRLAEVRARELECAVAALGIETLEWLGYRDSGMAGTPSNQNPACFNMADPDEATGRLVRLIRRHRPQVLVSYDANGSYGHPDHIKAHQITGLAFDAAGDPARYPDAGPAWQPQKLYQSGITPSQFKRWIDLANEMNIEIPWLRQRQEDDRPRGLPDDAITTTVDVSSSYEKKLAAFRCHRSQIRPDAFFMQLAAELARRGQYEEQFGLLRAHVETTRKETDLFAGLR